VHRDVRQRERQVLLVGQLRRDFAHPGLAKRTDAAEGSGQGARHGSDRVRIAAKVRSVDDGCAGVPIGQVEKREGTGHRLARVTDDVAQAGGIVRRAERTVLAGLAGHGEPRIDGLQHDLGGARVQVAR